MYLERSKVDKISEKFMLKKKKEEYLWIMRKKSNLFHSHIGILRI